MLAIPFWRSIKATYPSALLCIQSRRLSSVPLAVGSVRQIGDPDKGQSEQPTASLAQISFAFARVSAARSGDEKCLAQFVSTPSLPPPLRGWGMFTK